MINFEFFIQNELPIRKELLRIFRNSEPEVIFDIGACEGEDSIRYSQLFRRSTIYAFEPLPSNYEKCLKNFNIYNCQNIILSDFALTNKKGTSSFHVSSGHPETERKSEWDYGNKSSSLYQPNPEYKKFSWLKFNQSIEVKTTTIDAYCLENGIQQVDYIHLDVQGSELNVLKGALNHLNSIKAIWVEVENVSIYIGQPLRKDLESFIISQRFVKIVDTALGDSGDQLWVNRNYSEGLSMFILKSQLITFLKRIYYKYPLFKKIKRMIYKKI